MIEILQIENNQEIFEFYKNIHIDFASDCGVMIAKERGEIIGYCTFILTDKNITITHIHPSDDVYLADGILRSALHIADFRGITSAFYSNTVDFNLLKMLNFIKDEENQTIKIEKLHESCSSCSNKTN